MANIFITYVESFHDLLKVWGQTNRTCVTYIEQRLQMLTQEFGKLSGPNPNSVCKDMFCFAKSDGIYYRARVISDVLNNSVVVLFIDYGNKECVDLSNIRLLSDSNDNVSRLIAQAEEFFLANIGSRGGWQPAVINGIRRDLCSSQHKYRVVHECENQNFIQINYESEDYASFLIRKDLARYVSIKEQTIVLKNAMKSLQQNMEQLVKTSVKGQNISYPPERESVNGEYSSHKTFPSQGPSVTVTNLNQMPGVMNSQTNSRQNGGNPPHKNLNNTVISPNTNPGQMLNPSMIEALANELKQHLFKEPQNVTPEETPLHYVTQVLDVGTTHSVYVSFIDDGPWSFSVQLVANEHELNKLVDDLAECKLAPIKLPITLGYPCIAKSIQYESHCRGVVVNVSHSAVKVFYVDFGNTEDLPLTHIFEIPAKLFKIKTLSQKFALSGLQRVKPSEEIKKAFTEVVENELLLLHVTTLEGENLPTCDLYLKNVNIKRILNEKVRHGRQCEPIELPRLGEIENVVVTWVDSPTRFYVQLKKNDNELINLKKELAEWGANGVGFSPEEIIPGVLCLSRFTGDNQWYRAIIMAVNSKTSVTVSYIDYGNRETVNPSELRKAGHGITRQLNSQAIQCSLYGFEENRQESGINALLEELVLEKELCIRVMATEGDHIVVKLFDDNGDILTTLNRRLSSQSTKVSDNKVLEKEAVNKTEKMTDCSKSSERKTPPKRAQFHDVSTKVKQNEKGPKKDTMSSGAINWRTEERVQVVPKKAESQHKGVKGQHGSTWRSSDKDLSSEKKWRNSDEERKNSNSIRKNVDNKKPVNSVNERLIKAAKENEQRGLKMVDDAKYPVKLENIALQGSKFEERHIEVGSVEDVIVTYFMNPNEVYVQLLSTSENFRKLMDDIQNYYVTKLPMSKIPKIGELVISKFKQDNVLYRAVVTESNPLTVRYVDYGNEEITERERLWPMDKSFLNLEVQSVKCSLPNLSPNGHDSWPEPNPEIDKIFEHEKYSCKFLEHREGVREVELTILENGKSVREELISAGFALPVESVQYSDHANFIDSINDKCASADFSLMKGEIYNVYVTDIIDPSEFYVQVDFNVWESIEKELNIYIESEDPSPIDYNSVTDLCLANVDNNWFRARIMEKRVTDAYIQLIDFGKKLWVPYEEIKQIPNNLAGYPAQAVQCSLDCDLEIQSNIAEEFKKCQTKYYLGFIHDTSENRLRITLYDPDGSKLRFLNSANDAPLQVCPIANLPLFRQETRITASYIASPNEIYVHRKIDISTIVELNTLLREFYSAGGDSFNEGESSFQLCAAKSTRDNCWYRAQVLSMNEESVNVFFIDYGNTETIPLENIKHLDHSLYEQYALAKKISLNIECEEDCSMEMTAKLCELIQNKEVVGLFAKVDDIMYSELIVDGNFVSDALNAKRISDDFFQNVIKKSEKENAIKVYISHVTSPNEFWIHEEQIGSELMMFQERIQLICAEGSQKKDIQVGDIVGGMFTDHLWYRMKVLEIEDNTVNVQFIDYGNTLKVDKSEHVMIELPQDILSVPVFAEHCSLKGRWKKEAAARFEEIITNHQDSFTLVELEKGNPRCVDLLHNGSSVTQLLISEGLESNKDKATRKQKDKNFVYISHINSPSDFYIRSDSDKALLDKVTNALRDEYTFEDVNAEEGQIYCAKSPEDDSLRRVKVLAKNADSVIVEFIDYGISGSVQNVKELPQELRVIPGLATHCALVYGNFVDTWSDAACDKFKEYSKERLSLEVVIQGSRISLVKLYTEDGKDVAEVLSELCENDGRTYVYVSHVNSPNDLYIQDMIDEKLEFITQQLADGDTFEELKEKQVGAYCAAKIPEDDVWRRAEIKNILGDQYEVFFIDIGSTCVTSELKELPVDVKCLMPAARWSSLNLPIANIPERMTEELINMSGGGDSIFRSRVIRPGKCNIISLMSEGKKLEEILLLSENVDICNILNIEIEESNTEKCEGSAFEDNDLKASDADGEKAAEIAINYSFESSGSHNKGQWEKGTVGTELQNLSVCADDNAVLEISEKAARYIGTDEYEDSFEDSSMKDSESENAEDVLAITNNENADDKVEVCEEECEEEDGTKTS